MLHFGKCDDCTRHRRSESVLILWARLRLDVNEWDVLLLPNASNSMANKS
jgi:hypothetical protein